jgi:AraC family transcriptional regulator
VNAHNLGVFRSIERRHLALPTFRPLIGPGYAAELQRTPPAGITLPVRRWHVVTLFLSDSACQRSGPDALLRFRAGSGTVYLRPAGPAETVLWPEGLHAVHLHIDPALLERAAGQPIGLPQTAPEREHELADLIRDLLRSAVVHGGAAHITDQIVRVICERLTARHAAPAPASPALRLGRLAFADLVRCIRSDPHAPLSVTRLAARCGYTRAHFTRAFTLLAGMSPHQFALRSRLERAKHLLGTGGYSVSAVAAATGFADQSHLTRTMRRFVGVTPGAYQALAARELFSC